MDNIEIQVHKEINDYKEKIYFLNFRQWIFAILIGVIVVPTYLTLRDVIGETITSYVVIAIAAVLGFIGFVKIHELAAEKIIPYWLRHYLFFAKPVKYITDKEMLKIQEEKKNRKKRIRLKRSTNKHKQEIKRIKKEAKEQKKLEKVKKKYPKVDRGKTKHEEADELIEKIKKLPNEKKQLILELLE